MLDDRLGAATGLSFAAGAAAGLNVAAGAAPGARSDDVVYAGHARSVERTVVAARRDTPVRQDENSPKSQPFSQVEKWVAIFLRKSSVWSYANLTRVGDGISHGRRHTLAVRE
jgi:hypothetical protein